MKVGDLEKLTGLAVHAAKEAGRIINSFSQQEVKVEHKDGGHTYASQVVTVVDRKAQDTILGTLNPSLNEYDFALLTESEDDLSVSKKNIFGALILWMESCFHSKRTGLFGMMLWLLRWFLYRWSMIRCMIFFGRQPRV